MNEDFLDPLTRRTRTLFTLGRLRGYVTYAEVAEALPSRYAPPEVAEEVMAALNEMDVHVVERPPERRA